MAGRQRALSRPVCSRPLLGPARRYDGRWYEHAFHDWTQFEEVYDTTFDIELSKDGKRWLDDFGVRGPSPAAAPTSWEKSPMTNGGHYFLYGKLNDKTPGVLDESGFGVTFPNFIVDVKRDEQARRRWESRDGRYIRHIRYSHYSHHSCYG